MQTFVRIGFSAALLAAMAVLIGGDALKAAVGLGAWTTKELLAACGGAAVCLAALRAVAGSSGVRYLQVRHERGPQPARLARAEDLGSARKGVRNRVRSRAAARVRATSRRGLSR